MCQSTEGIPRRLVKAANFRQLYPSVEQKSSAMESLLVPVLAISSAISL